MWTVAQAFEDCGVALPGDLHLHSVIGEEMMEADDRHERRDRGRVPHRRRDRHRADLVPGAAVGQHRRARRADPADHRHRHRHPRRQPAARDPAGRPGLGDRRERARAAAAGDRRPPPARGAVGPDEAPPVLPARATSRSGRTRCTPTPACRSRPTSRTAPRSSTWSGTSRARRPSRCSAEIEAQVAAVAQLDPWLREHPPLCEWLMNWLPYETEWEHPLTQTMARAHGSVTGATVAASVARGAAQLRRRVRRVVLPASPASRRSRTARAI